MNLKPQFLIPPPLSLYIHIPWCVKKCPYCDFNSHTRVETLPETAYVSALLDDLERDQNQAEQRTLTSIFIGGGTPSLFSARAIADIITGIKKYFKVDPTLEITLEANPGTLEYQKFAEFKSAGITRLSIGVQSFNNDHLTKLGRIHDRTAALRAIENAHAVGFGSFNIDLMYALPQQTCQQAMEDLHTGLALEPPHLSWYHLTIEPNTLFYKNPPPLPDHDTSYQIEEQGQALLHQHGLIQYEVSAFSRSPQLQSKHNRNYWEFGDYLAIGAGAHGKLTHCEKGEVQRCCKFKTPHTYMGKNSINHQYTSNRNFLSVNDLVFEFMLNGLRLSEGVSFALFEKHTGLPRIILTPSLQRALDRELLTPSPTTIKPSPLGKRFLNDLINLFEDTQHF